MASKESYLSMLPTGIREPLRKLFNSGATLTNTLAGNVTGNVTGTLTGEVTKTATAYAADTDLGDADFTTSLVTLSGASATCNITKWTPTVGKMYVLTCLDSSNAVTVTLSSGITWDGTNDTATFDAAAETITVVAISATRLMIVANPNTVAFS